MASKSTTRAAGFTIIELIVVISVIGILAGLTIFGIGAWRQRATETRVSSDLTGATAAMESSRNFNNGYPADIPPTFSPSDDVTLKYVSGDTKNFCIEASSISMPSVVFFVNTSEGVKKPTKGTCVDGATPVPGGGDGSGGIFANVSMGSGGLSCGLTTSKRAYCWGYGYLASSPTPTTSLIPFAIKTIGTPMSGKSIAQIVVGSNYTLALSSGGEVYGWGENGNGQLGNGSSYASMEVPTSIATGGTPMAGKLVSSLVATNSFALAVSTEGNVYSWGYNSPNGYLGNNSTTSSRIPVAVATAGTPMAGKTIRMVAAYVGTTLALADDGSVYSWGANLSGQLGNNTTTLSKVPVAVTTAGTPMAGKTITSVAAGSDHSLALASDGTIYAWGYNVNGQLGNNSTTRSLVPVAVTTAGTPMAGKTIIAIAAGNNHSLALASDGSVYSWGGNNNGQLGNNSTTQSQVPIVVTTAGTPMAGKVITSISAGGFISAVGASDGTLFTWGNNNQGQLGNNSTTQSLLPVIVSSP